MTWLLKLIGFDPIGKIVDGLNEAHKARLQAKNDSERIQADVTIERLQTALKDAQEQASVIKKGMDFKIFWVPWAMAAIPAALWFGWGVLDSTVYAGAILPDVAELPPQLQAYFDVVWQNIFYTGVVGVGIQTVGKVLSRGA